MKWNAVSFGMSRIDPPVKKRTKETETETKTNGDAECNYTMYAIATLKCMEKRWVESISFWYPECWERERKNNKRAWLYLDWHGVCGYLNLNSVKFIFIRFFFCFARSRHIINFTFKFSIKSVDSVYENEVAIRNPTNLKTRWCIWNQARSWICYYINVGQSSPKYLNFIGCSIHWHITEFSMHICALEPQMGYFSYFLRWQICFQSSSQNDNITRSTLFFSLCSTVSLFLSLNCGVSSI